MRRRVQQLTVRVSIVIVHWLTYVILICVQPDKIDGALAKYFGAAAEIPNDAGLLITCFVNVVNCQWRIRSPVHVGDACYVWQVHSCRHRLPPWCLVPNVVCRCRCVPRRMEKGWLTSLYWNNERINSCLQLDWLTIAVCSYYIGCLGYPTCKNAVWFYDCIHEATVTTEQCTQVWCTLTSCD